MSKYTTLDNMIVISIMAGSDTFTLLLQSGHLVDEAWKHDTGTGADRVIDRRLQALRKAGRIKYAAGKWEVVG